MIEWNTGFKSDFVRNPDDDPPPLTPRQQKFEVGTGEGMVWERGEALVLYTIGNEPRTSPDGAETLSAFARWARRRVE